MQLPIHANLGSAVVVLRKTAPQLPHPRTCASQLILATLSSLSEPILTLGNAQKTQRLWEERLLRPASMASAQLLDIAAQVYSKHSLAVTFKREKSAHKNLKTVKLEIKES